MESLFFISSFVRISIGLPFIALDLSHLRRGDQEINKKKPQYHRYIKWAKTNWYITYNFYFCISSFYHIFNYFIILLLIILTNIEFLPLFDSPSCVLLMNAMQYITEPYEKYLCIILKFISFRVWSGRASWSDCFYMYNTNASRNCDEIWDWAISRCRTQHVQDFDLANVAKLCWYRNTIATYRETTVTYMRDCSGNMLRVNVVNLIIQTMKGHTLAFL